MILHKRIFAISQATNIYIYCGVCWCASGCTGVCRCILCCYCGACCCLRSCPCCCPSVVVLDVLLLVAWVFFRILLLIWNQTTCFALSVRFLAVSLQELLFHLQVTSLLLLVCTDSFFSSCQYGIGCVGSGGGGQSIAPFLECFKAVVSPKPISSYESLSLVGKVDFSLGVSPGSFGSNLSEPKRFWKS